MANEKKANIKKYDYIMMVNFDINWNHLFEIGQIVNMTRNQIGDVDTYSVRFKNETIVVGEELPDYCKVLQFKEE